MNKPFQSFTKNSTSITKIINELPCKKNPFLAIAYPSAIEIKDRSHYCNDYRVSVIGKEHDVFTLQGDASYVTESLDQIKTRNTSINEDFMSAIQNQNRHFLSIGCGLPIQLSHRANIILENDQSNTNETNDQRDDKLLTELNSNQLQINLLNEPNPANTSKQYGVIVKNMYKRNHLSRKSTFQTQYSENSQKENSLFSIASKFITRKSEQFKSHREPEIPSIHKEKSQRQSEVQTDTNEQYLTERGKKLLGKIIPFFN